MLMAEAEGAAGHAQLSTAVDGLSRPAPRVEPPTA